VYYKDFYEGPGQKFLEYRALRYIFGLDYSECAGALLGRAAMGLRD
jgi:hypothetical protein